MEQQLTPGAIPHHGLQLNWSSGNTYKVFVQKGRDWEKKNSFVFTGLNQAGVATWGKKK